MAKSGIHPLVWGGVAAFLGYLFLKADASQQKANKSQDEFVVMRAKKIEELTDTYNKLKASGHTEAAEEVMKKIRLIQQMQGASQ